MYIILITIYDNSLIIGKAKIYLIPCITDDYDNVQIKQNLPTGLEDKWFMSKTSKKGLQLTFQ